MRIAAAAALALLIATASLPAAASGDWTEAQSVVEVTTDYLFSPRHLRFRRGVAYRLQLENRGAEMHQFSAPEFFKSVELGNPEVLNRDRTEIVLRPGERKLLLFRAREAGRFRLICPDHDWTGMIADITVE